MDFKNTSVMNFKGSFRGLRNPLESWNKSDSIFDINTFENFEKDLFSVATAWMGNENKIRKLNKKPIYEEEEYSLLLQEYEGWLIREGSLRTKDEVVEYALIGPNDLELAQKMIRAGSSDRKFLRQIFVSVDITAPLYWWKEMDTYKIGTVTNSTSTMHKLASTPITKNCFEMNDSDQDMMMYQNDFYTPDTYLTEYWDMFINDLEHLRKRYNETKDKKYWKELIRLLPESWLQTRTWTANYEILRNIYQQRKNHKLVEWKVFNAWIKTLPYAGELILFNLEK